MDKSRVHESSLSPAYEAGVARFLDYAFANGSLDGRNTCPCMERGNISIRSRDVVYEHLIFKEIDEGYASHVWSLHGEDKLRWYSNEILDEDRNGGACSNGSGVTPSHSHDLEARISEVSRMEDITRAMGIAFDQMLSALKQDLSNMEQLLQTIACKFNGVKTISESFSSMQGSDPNKPQPPDDTGVDG